MTTSKKKKKITKKKSFTVRRKNWARGGKNGEAALLNLEGNMCYLGFACNQISRVRKKDMLSLPSPMGVLRAPSFLTEGEYDAGYGEWDVEDNALTKEAMTINDNASITDKTREERLKKLFKKHNVIVKFVD